MVTTVGTESDLVDMLNNLIQLDYDAIDAYDTAIDRLDSAEYKARRGSGHSARTTPATPASSATPLPSWAASRRSRAGPRA